MRSGAVTLEELLLEALAEGLLLMALEAAYGAAVLAGDVEGVL